MRTAARSGVFSGLLCAAALGLFALPSGAASDPCAQSQGAARVAIAREGRVFVARAKTITCIKGPLTVASAQIVWGDGTSTALAGSSLAVEPEALAGDYRVVLHGSPSHSYDRANCPASRRLLYRCQAGYRLALVVQGAEGRTIESEPFAVSVLASSDRVSIASVVRSGSTQILRGRIDCGGERRAHELAVTVDWGQSHRTVVHLHGTAKSFRFTVGHRLRGKGPRYVRVTVIDRLARASYTASRTLR